MWDKFWPPPWILSTSKFPSILLTSFSNASKSFEIYGREREREKHLSWYRGRDGEVSSQSSNHNVCSKMTRERVWVNPPCLVHAEGLFHETRKSSTFCSFSVWKCSVLHLIHIWKTLQKPPRFLANNQTISLMFTDWFLNSFYWVSFCNPIEHSKECLLLKGEIKKTTLCQRYAGK